MQHYQKVSELIKQLFDHHRGCHCISGFVNCCTVLLILSKAQRPVISTEFAGCHGDIWNMRFQSNENGACIAVPQFRDVSLQGCGLMRKESRDSLDRKTVHPLGTSLPRKRRLHFLATFEGAFWNRGSDAMMQSVYKCSLQRVQPLNWDTSLAGYVEAIWLSCSIQMNPV